MIAVSFALPAESSGLIDLLQDKQSVAIGPAKVVQGKIGERAVAIMSNRRRPEKLRESDR